MRIMGAEGAGGMGWGGGRRRINNGIGNMNVYRGWEKGKMVDGLG